MKTKTKYSIEKFKNRYYYNPTDCSIGFKDFTGEILPIQIDIGVGDVMNIKFEIPGKGTEIVTQPRITSADTGFYNIPIIHTDKLFFDMSSDIQDCIMTHEIGHLMLQSLNTFRGDYPYFSEHVVHSDVYEYCINKLKNDVTAQYYDAILNLIKENCEEYESNKSNIDHRDLYFWLVELSEKYEKYVDCSDGFAFIFANEIEAELFSFVRNKNFLKIMNKYYTITFPRFIYKWNRNHPNQKFRTDPIDVGKLTFKLVLQAISNSKIYDRLYVYQLI